MTVNFTVDIQFGGTLDKMCKGEMKNIMEEGMSRTALDTINDGQKICPYDTGALRSSLEPTDISMNGFKIQGYDYGKWLDIGTRKTTKHQGWISSKWYNLLSQTADKQFNQVLSKL
ncbi:MAG: hypothetical protein HUJ68_08470 [Clostridia bacterium]|nr:hypothetical protein [Clostridia bacterium]